MPSIQLKNVQDLSLDLFNFRTVPQKNEIQAVQAMISISPDRFWALMESLIADGYLPTENIIVLEDGGILTVREGNRRIGALKIIYGYIPDGTISVPANIQLSIDKLSDEWKDANDKVPCTIYSKGEATLVDKIVTLAHGKGEKASRDQWNAVARARHNRDILKMSEPAIDLLEKYLSQGKNLTANQAARWAGEYPLSVLDEAIKKIATRLGATNSVDLAKSFPKVKYKDALEGILKDVGLQIIRFEHIRSKSKDFAEDYGVPPLQNTTGAGTGTAGAGTTGADTAGAGTTGAGTTGAGTTGAGTTGAGTTGAGTTGAGTTGAGTTGAGTAGAGTAGAGTAGAGTAGAGTAGAGTAGAGTTGTSSSKSPAFAINDPKAVAQALKTFVPLGTNREKVVTLLIEIRKLKLKDNPIAFCFLLRSMFEISGKAYCNDHSSAGLSATKADGQDRFLIDVLRDVTSHMTSNGADKKTIKILHGALAELAKKDGFLSVTSMNQLVHNATFSLTAGDISTLFGNVFPLLHAMNQ